MYACTFDCGNDRSGVVIQQPAKLPIAMGTGRQFVGVIQAQAARRTLMRNCVPLLRPSSLVALQALNLGYEGRAHVCTERGRRDMTSLKG